MKNFKKVLALVLAVATLLSFATIASASVADFKDSKDVTHTEAVDVLSTIGVLNGYTDGSYKPGNVITRAEAAKIIAMFDNGDTDIDELYAPVNFTDVASNHWAQSYISYCYHTGIIAGVGNNKYAPEAEVTGVQFLKMVLVVLGFDAKEEGLVGTGYAVNARKLALEVGLLEGIGNDFDYTKGLTRDNAAQIMLNALASSTVAYGKTIEINSGKYVVVNDSKAYYTGELLAKEWNLYYAYGQDEFGRPGHEWYWFHTDHAPAVAPTYRHGNTKYLLGTYTDTPLATYNTAVAGCDIYDDTGLKGEFIKYTDGDLESEYNEKTEKWTGTEVVVDSAKDMHGAQGQITEVYAVRGEFGKVNEQIIVHINTYLAQVTKVNKEVKDSKGHITTARSISFTTADNEDLIWTRKDNKNYKETEAAKHLHPVDDVFKTESFEKGDYVLVQGVVDNTKYTIDVVNVEAAKTEVAKLTSVDNIHDVATLGVNKTETPVAAKYAYEADRGVADVGTEFTFIYDSFGNVIGTVDAPEAALNYAVLDKLYIDYTKGIATVYATIVMPDGSKVEDVVVNKIKYIASYKTEGNVKTPVWDTVTAWEWIAEKDDDFLEGYGQQFQWAGSTFYTKYFYGRMINYVANENGSYNLTVPAVVPSPSAAVIKNGSKYIMAYAQIVDDEGNVIGYGDLTNVLVKVDAETKFLFQNGKTTPKSEYTAYTGYDKIPNLTYSKIQYVDQDEDGVAEFVYVFNPQLATTLSKVVYEGAEPRYDLDIGYTYAVKVIGEDGKMTAATVISEEELFAEGEGLYNVTVDASGVATETVKVAANIQLHETEVDAVYIYVKDGKNVVAELEDATLYNFSDKTGVTVSKLDGQTVAFLEKDGKIVAVVLYNWTAPAAAE